MFPLVSVIMPTYNAERHIAQSIRSVVDQTYADWELIVVDDGSTDRTAEVVRGFSDADARIRYLHQRNSGPSCARNVGIESSRGDLIAFLDSDDLWLREKLSLQLRTMVKTTADLVFSGGYIFTDKDSLDETRTFSPDVGRFGGAEMFVRLLARNSIPTLSVLMRRSVLDDDGLFDEAYRVCEDYDMWLRLARRGAVFYGMEEKLVRYRRHSTSLTHKDSEMLRAMIAVTEKHIGESGLGPQLIGGRLRNLYRNLIAALVAEGDINEAKACLRALSSWDRRGVVTRIQKTLLEVWPSKYNFISRECLYRAEWHIGRMTTTQSPRQ